MSNLQAPGEVEVAVYSIANARHACRDVSQPVAHPRESFCAFCGGELVKTAEIRASVCMMRGDHLKPFLVDLGAKIKALIKKEVAAYAAQETT